MGTIAPRLPKNSVSTVSGIVNSSSGIGNTLMSPLTNSLIATGGLAHGMRVLSIPIALMIPVSFLMGRNSTTDKAYTNTDEEKLNIKELFSSALKNKTYIYLMIAFFTCGFHMAIITNHLPTEFLSYGFSSEITSYAFSIYGITTIIGSILSGSLCTRFKMKNILGTFFGLRPIVVIIFLLLPKTLFTIYFFTIFLGFTGAATVPPVSGIIGKNFGIKGLSTLFGFVFFIHQIGGFFSAWLGGVCFETTGSYIIIWVVDIILCIIATCVSFLID